MSMMKAFDMILPIPYCWFISTIDCLDSIYVITCINSRILLEDYFYKL